MSKKETVVKGRLCCTRKTPLGLIYLDALYYNKLFKGGSDGKNVSLLLSLKEKLPNNYIPICMWLPYARRKV